MIGNQEMILNHMMLMAVPLNLIKKRIKDGQNKKIKIRTEVIKTGKKKKNKKHHQEKLIMQLKVLDKR